MDAEHAEHWNHEIKPSRSIFELHLEDVWKYRDLLIMFVKRDFVSVYKQTILGPLWFFIQPILTTLMFTFVFGRIANISTGGLPPTLFYLAGLTIWNYFSDSLTQTSDTFIKNAAVFGKVYFPRLIVPLSVVISGLLKFAIQLLLFAVVYFYYYTKGTPLQINAYILLLPLLIIIMAGYGLGLGMIISSLTTKYRDLRFLITFGIQLLMYATPIIIPLSEVPAKYKPYLEANPLTPVVESFKYALLGHGEFTVGSLAYSFGMMMVFLLGGIMIFNKVERSFMDTV
jgi:lipopolysaccharide transport system permease protein